jgi:hypothetical protein
MAVMGGPRHWSPFERDVNASVSRVARWTNMTPRRFGREYRVIYRELVEEIRRRHGTEMG